jgi:1-acyl-sn-glycerol-3-phosphate acyltransferase
MPILDTIQTYWARSLVFVSGIRVEVEGYDHLLPFTSAGKAVLFMPNHASGLDPFILRGYLPMAPRFIFKRSLMLQLPPIFVLGYLLGHIPINRSNRGSAIQSLSSAAEKLKERQSILIFPEGTRSKTGKLLEFKRGPFYLAHDSRAPIVPVYVEGAFELWSAAGWRFHPDPGTIRVRIFPPMTTKEEESVDQLEAKVRAVLLKAENEKKPVPQKSHYLSLLFSIFALAALVNVVQYFFL